MKRILLILSAVLPLAGCASYQGGAGEDFGTAQEVYPTPAGSPSMRPGMNPTDIRDPNALSRPAPPVIPGAPPGVALRP